MIASTLLVTAAVPNGAVDTLPTLAMCIAGAGLMGLFFIVVLIFLDDGRGHRMESDDVQFVGHFFGRRRFRLGVSLVIADVLISAVAVIFVLSLS